MKTDRKAFIKKMNWTLAGIIGLLGFAGCEKGNENEDIIMLEYGVPPANYTVKGAVVNKATGKPIAGIRVGMGYDTEPRIVPMYGVPTTPYVTKSSVLTNAKGEFILTDRFHDREFQIDNNSRTLPVFVTDVDGEKNGLFQSEFLQVDFPRGTYTVTKNVELTEIENK